MYMKQLLKDGGKEALRQLFGLQKPRGGRIVLTRYAFRKMNEYKLDVETLENAFRHGRQTRVGKIIHKYARYSIGLYYKRMEPSLRNLGQMETTYLITTCWKGR
jgi:hypothetical protein